jgi:hypothetical protein
MVLLDWRKNEDEQLEVLVQWEGLFPEDATWENYQDLQSTYPVFDHEDVVNLDGTRDVTNDDADWDQAELRGESTPPARDKRKSIRPKHLNDYVTAPLKKGGRK